MTDARIAIVAALLVAGAAFGQDIPIPKHRAKQIADAAPAKPSAVPRKPRRALIFNTPSHLLAKDPHKGYCTPYGCQAMKTLGTKTGAYQPETSDDVTVFLPESIKRFDAVILNNACGQWITPTAEQVAKLPGGGTVEAVEARLRKSILDYVRAGGGIVAYHYAMGANRNWPEFGELLGGRIAGHPWNEEVGIQIEEPNHPLVAAFGGKGFRLHEEIFQYREPWDRATCRVLISLDNAVTNMNPKNYTIRKDRDFARYIVGQIHHARGEAGQAITWYGKVADKYPDAKQAIDYFEAKRISLEEINVFRPGEPVELKLAYRNVREAFCQVYRVDLMKLYLREKNLSNITKVNLAGIRPLIEQTIGLGDGKDYVDKDRAIKLALKDEGAYLVICRGDDLFASALALVTPLKIEVQEDAVSGRVRANVLHVATNQCVPEVHVKAIGSADTEFRSGETDLRGVFVGDNVRGKATVIARQGDARYAFYRGEKWLGAPKEKPRRPSAGAAAPAAAQPDYEMNLRSKNIKIQSGNVQLFDSLRRGKQSGV